MATPSAIRIYIVRHGETDANRLGILQGQMDTPLNANGVLQAEQTAEALERVRFVGAYASDLQRAGKTAEIILSKHPGVELKRYEELRERSLGSLEGKKTTELGRAELSDDVETSAVFAARVIRWWNKIVVQRHAQQAQVRDTAAKATAEQDTSQDKYEESIDTASGTSDTTKNESSRLSPQQPNTIPNILVVSHGGAIGTLVIQLLGSRKLRCAEGVVVGRCINASISVVEVRASGNGVLLSYADTTHLEETLELVEVNADVVGDEDSDGAPRAV
ncbi:hypothetical protein EIP91_000830 [Steccherinum ochraceum]|uniref:Phosphoglycerate mutase n=1 Tax=Steccherinum ochraceum TaxID=92696 RepID=A0A4R0S304_9APHY|nr:hypothetical protein EIP91_000830 [Steccherinum ochraceum]